MFDTSLIVLFRSYTFLYLVLSCLVIIITQTFAKVWSMCCDGSSSPFTLSIFWPCSLSCASTCCLKFYSASSRVSSRKFKNLQPCPDLTPRELSIATSIPTLWLERRRPAACSAADSTAAAAPCCVVVPWRWLLLELVLVDLIEASTSLTTITTTAITTAAPSTHRLRVRLLEVIVICHLRV